MINCPNCAQPSDDSRPVCAACGSALDQPPTPAEENPISAADQPAETLVDPCDIPEINTSDDPPAPARKKRRWLPWVIVGGILLELILTVLAALWVYDLFFKNTNTTPLAHSVYVSRINYTETVVIFDDQIHICLENIRYDDDVPFIGISPLQDSVAYITENDEAYVVTAFSDPVLIDRDVQGMIFSLDSRYLLYSQKTDDTSRILRYSLDTASSELVTDAYEPETFISSPNLQSVYYEKPDATAYLWKQGETVQVTPEEGMHVYALSDDAEYVYSYRYGEDSASLFISNGLSGGYTQLGQLPLDYESSLYFNVDASEVLFCATDGYSYLSREGQTPVLVCQGAFSYPVLPYTVAYSGFPYAYLDTLVGSQMVAGANLFTLGETVDQTVHLCSHNDEYILSQDCSQILIYQDRKLYRADTKTGAKEILAVNIDVKDLDASTDLNIVYFVTNNGEVYYINGTKLSRIANVSNAKFVYVNYQGTACFIECSDGLYVTSHSNDAEHLSVVAGDIEQVQMGPNQFIIETSVGIYVSNGFSDPVQRIEFY